MPKNLLALGDENKLAHVIREALGVGDYDRVIAVTPQFEREDGKEVYYFPKTKDEFDRLKQLPGWLLKDMGLRVWDEEDGRVLWLYPGEWYDCIPEDYEITDIFKEKEFFKKNQTDDDIRFGCLSYGFLREKETT